MMLKQFSAYGLFNLASNYLLRILRVPYNHIEISIEKFLDLLFCSEVTLLK